jgi:hypothetical protein
MHMTVRQLRESLERLPQDATVYAGHGAVDYRLNSPMVDSFGAVQIGFNGKRWPNGKPKKKTTASKFTLGFGAKGKPGLKPKG